MTRSHKKGLTAFSLFWLWKLITFFLDDLWQYILYTKYQQHSRAACKNFKDISSASLSYEPAKLYNWKGYKSFLSNRVTNLASPSQIATGPLQVPSSIHVILLWRTLLKPSPQIKVQVSPGVAGPSSSNEQSIPPWSGAVRNEHTGPANKQHWEDRWNHFLWFRV